MQGNQDEATDKWDRAVWWHARQRNEPDVYRLHNQVLKA